jgi:hypothetical protein
VIGLEIDKHAQIPSSCCAEPPIPPTRLSDGHVRQRSDVPPQGTSFFFPHLRPQSVLQGFLRHSCLPAGLFRTEICSSARLLARFVYFYLTGGRAHNSDQFPLRSDLAASNTSAPSHTLTTHLMVSLPGHLPKSGYHRFHPASPRHPSAILHDACQVCVFS